MKEKTKIAIGLTILLIGSAIFLLLAAIYWFVMYSGDNSSSAVVMILLIIDASLFLLSAYSLLVSKRRYIFAIRFFVVINILATITDQFGLFDAAFLVLQVSILVLLYFHSREIPSSKIVP